MKLSDIVKYFDFLYPRELSEEWDNDGLVLCPSADVDIQRILTCLDVTDSAVEKAAEEKCSLIISHHPLIFKPLKNITEEDYQGKKIIRLINERISVLSLHTRFDAAENGLNFNLIKVLGVNPDGRFGSTDDKRLIGRTGLLQKPETPIELAERVSKALNCDVRLYSADRQIRRIGVVSGGGKDYIIHALKSGIDAFISGDLSYNSVLDAREAGMTVIDAGHFNTEIICTKIFKNALADLSDKLTVIDFTPNNSGQIIINK